MFKCRWRQPIHNSIPTFRIRPRGEYVAILTYYEILTVWAWLIFLEALRISVASVKFTSSYSEHPASQADMSKIYEQMEALDKWVVQLSTKAENYATFPSSMELDPVYESTTAQVMRRLSQIRLSRCVQLSR